MKKRLGFVSNSSSSSFIVAFPSRPKDAEEMCLVLFGDLGNLAHPYDDVSYPTDVVAQAVFDQIEGKKPATREEIVAVVHSGWFEGCPYPPLGNHDDKAKWEAYLSKCREAAATKADEFLAANKGHEFFVLEFSDKTQLGCALEHGGVFDGMPHLAVSHH